MNIDKIWSEYRMAIKAFLHNKVSNPDDVEDLLQEVLIRTHQNLDTLKSKDSVKSWIFQIARNTVIDFYRKRKGAEGIHPEDLWYTAQESETEHEFAPCIEPFLKALPEETAKMIRAIDIKGQAQKDYARENGIPYSTLKSRVQSGRKQLHALFHECCFMSFDQWGNVLDYEVKPGKKDPSAKE